MACTVRLTILIKSEHFMWHDWHSLISLCWETPLHHSIEFQAIIFHTWSSPKIDHESPG